MNTSRLFYALIGLAIAAAAFLLIVKIQGAKDAESIRVVGSSALIVIIAAVAVAIIAALPFIYKRKVEKKGGKNLSRYLMLDPRFREALLDDKRARAGGHKQPAPKGQPSPSAEDIKNGKQDSPQKEPGDDPAKGG